MYEAGIAVCALPLIICTIFHGGTVPIGYCNASCGICRQCGFWHWHWYSPLIHFRNEITQCPVVTAIVQSHNCSIMNSRMICVAILWRPAAKPVSIFGGPFFSCDVIEAVISNRCPSMSDQETYYRYETNLISAEDCQSASHGRRATVCKDCQHVPVVFTGNCLTQRYL